jgi:hypothetical protein
VLVPGLPPLLDQIVRRTMAKEPATRYRNAGQLAQILRTQVAASLPPPRPAEASALGAPPPTHAPERLVVPPPPAPTMATTWSPDDPYQVEQHEEWSEESTGIDWMMIALFIAALLAVLGLIPLWRAVYRRYAAPPPVPAAGTSYHFDWEASLEPRAAPRSTVEIWEQTELGTCGHVWYNLSLRNGKLSPPASRGGLGRFCFAPAAKHRFGSPAYGFPDQDVVHWPGRV